MSFVLLTEDLHQLAFLTGESDGSRSAQPYLDLASRFETSEQAESALASVSQSRNAPVFVITPFAKAESLPGVMRHPRTATRLQPGPMGEQIDAETIRDVEDDTVDGPRP